MSNAAINDQAGLRLTAHIYFSKVFKTLTSHINNLQRGKAGELEP